MPVARGPQINARSAVLVGLTGVVIALLLGAMVLWATSSGDGVELNLGDTVFDAGFVGRQSEEIAAGGPILYGDAGSGTRDLYVQHIGEDPDVGWLAFSARRVGDPRDCSAIWDPTAAEFALTSSSDVVCDPVSFSELGCGLVRFPVEILDGRVTVFLNEDFDEVAEAFAVEPDDAPPTTPGPDLTCDGA